MVDKAEMIKRLTLALQKEEKVIGIYTEHLDSAMFWTGISEDAAGKIKASFHILAEQSGKHKKMVEELIDRLKKD